MHYSWMMGNGIEGKKEKKDRQKGFLKRILLTYLSVLIIPLILLNILVFRLSVDHARVLDEKFADDYATRVAAAVDNELIRMELVAYDVRENLKIRASWLEERNSNILTAQEFLDSYTVANPFFSDLLYYPRNGQIFYGSKSVYSMNTYTRFFLAVPEITKYEVFRKINAINAPTMIKWTGSEEGEITPNFHYLVPLDSTTDRDASLIFLIPFPNLARLMEVDKNPPPFPIALTDSRGRLIYSYIPEGHNKGEEMALLLSRKDVPGSYQIVRGRAKNSRWTVTALMPETTILPAIRRALFLVTLLTFAILLSELLIIRFALRFTYNPLRSLAETLTPEGQISDVLKTLEQGVHDLQTSSESAYLQLQREDFIGSLIQGERRDEEETLVSKAALLGLEGTGLLYPFLIDFRDREEGNRELFDAYYEHLTGLLSSPLTAWYEPLTQQIIGVIRSEGPEDGTIRESLNEAMDQLFEEIGLKGELNLCEPGENYGTVRDNLQRAMKRNWDLIKNNSGLKEELEGFYHLFTDGKKAEAERKAGEIYDRLTDREESGYITYRFFTLISRTLPGGESNILKREWLRELENLSRGEEKGFILRLINESEDIRRELSKQSSLKADQLQEITSYIDVHYLDGSFSVGALADHLNMSLSSVSLLFKRNRGVGIAAYVGSRRIEKAEELLRQGYPVNEVVTMVGYSDPTSFIKKFKKITGRTPGDASKS